MSLAYALCSRFASRHGTHSARWTGRHAEMRESVHALGRPNHTTPREQMGLPRFVSPWTNSCEKMREKLEMLRARAWGAPDFHQRLRKIIIIRRKASSAIILCLLKAILKEPPIFRSLACRTVGINKRMSQVDWHDVTMHVVAVIGFFFIS